MRGQERLGSPTREGVPAVLPAAREQDMLANLHRTAAVGGSHTPKTAHTLAFACSQCMLSSG